MPTPRIVLILVVLAGALSVGAGTRVAPTASEILAKFESELADHLRESRPDLAVRYGVRDAVDTLRPFPEDAIARSAKWFEGYMVRLDAFDRRRLDPAAGVRADSLVARAKRAFEESRADGSLRREAAPWLSRIENAVFAPFVEDPVRGVAAGSPCDRMRRATQLLHAVPEFVRSVELTLRSGPVTDAGQLPARVTATIDSLRVALPRRADSCRDPQRVADFVVADTLAARVILRFAEIAGADVAAERRP